MNKISKYTHFLIQLIVLAFSFYVFGLSIVNGIDDKLYGQKYIILITYSIAFLFLEEFSWLFIDYKKHKNPLLAVDPEVDYSFMHHIKQVTIPTFKYRLSTLFKKTNKK